MAKVSDVYYSLGCSSEAVKAEEETSKVRQENCFQKSQSNSGRWEAGPVLLQNRLLQLVQLGLPIHRPPPRRPRLGARSLAGLFHLLPILETVTPPSLLHNISTCFHVLPFLSNHSLLMYKI